MTSLLILTFLTIAGFVALIVYRVIKAKKYREQVESVTSLDQGTWSERDLIPQLLNKCGIDPRAIYHDLYIRKENGAYTQIDLAVPTPQGILLLILAKNVKWQMEKLETTEIGNGTVTVREVTISSISDTPHDLTL